MDKVQARIIALEMSLTGNMLEDMEIKDKIHKLKMEINDVSPSCSLGEECENCGS